MSLFFDVWMNEGFVLASDVMIREGDSKKEAHKIFCAPSTCPISCAMAVCGDYPEACQNFFIRATCKDTLKDIAQEFAKRWTERYGGTKDYSGVHLVGFEKMHDNSLTIPQMWFWCNWSPQGFREKSHFDAELASFEKPIPDNNHIPHKISEKTGGFPKPDLLSEAEGVRSFLNRYQPFFTWNGDTKFWRSVAEAVGSAMNLLSQERTKWSIQDVVKCHKTVSQVPHKRRWAFADSYGGFITKGRMWYCHRETGRD